MKYTKTIEALPDEEVVSTIKNRPWNAQVAFLLVGVGLIAYRPSQWYFGAFFLMMAILPFFTIKDVVTCMLYKDKLVAFNPKNPNEIEIIYYDNIDSYQLDPRGHASVTLFLKSAQQGNNSFTISSYRSTKLRVALGKLLPKRDYDLVNMERMNTLRSEAKQKSKTFWSRKDK